MKYGSSHWRARKELGEPRACLASIPNVVGVGCGSEKEREFSRWWFFRLHLVDPTVSSWVGSLHLADQHGAVE